MTATASKKKNLKLPHIYVLLFGITVLCTILTWILPAGSFDRTLNEAGREIVVAGTFHLTDPSPVGPFEMFKCIYEGLCDAAGVTMFVFVAYAFIGLIISTGAFDGLIAGLLRTFKGKSKAIIIPIFITLIGFASSTIGVFEETFPFIPIFVGISIAMGYDAIVGLAIVALAAAIGYSGAFMNPFTVGTAQSIADLPIMSGAGFRIFCHICMIIVASVYTVRYALKIEKDPTKSLVYGETNEFAISEEEVQNHPFGIREKLVLATLLAGILLLIYGTKTFGWYFTELSALFIIMGLVSALIMGWSSNVIAGKLSKSFSDIAEACLMIGIARGVLIVLQHGNIIDTVVYGLSLPLVHLPSLVSAECMLLVQTLINFLMPSGSGQAVVSMPIMAPLSDIIHVQRQIAVLCFQYGDGLSNVLWPTALTPVVTGIAGVKLEKWWKWFIPLFLMLLATQMVTIAIAVLIGWS
ncbi:putative ion transporter superfamily protein YfcC [Fusobacterium naviforme]|nr:YfcC family protein [Fusobacterium naviforme]PSL09357.1 putative ion transporter superfamily protein YfcC [Fusobacterium naviforme]STO27994.1 C4-dicarboxylate anaerobic carrier [Fusobacterium naviforme]